MLKATYRVAALLPIFCIVYLVSRYGVNVPFWDQWELVPLLEKALTGVLTLSDIWAQHNEHRIFFPLLIMLPVAILTKWNIFYELIINIALAGGILFFLSSMLTRSFGKSLYPWLLPLFSFLIFSPSQWENWTWGWQIQIFLNVLGFVAAVWAVSRWPSQLKGLILAAVFSTVSSYSFNNGLLSWVVIAIIFLRGKENVRYLTGWTVAFAVIVFLYYHGYKAPAHPSVLIPLKHPYDYIRYILAYLGSPLGFGNRNVSIAIGLILLVATFASTIIIRCSGKEEYMRLSPWLALGLYALFSACATGIGRLGFGVDQALASRYTTISVLFIISSLVLIVIYVEHFTSAHHALPAKGLIIISSLSALLALALVLSFYHGTKEIVEQSERMHVAADGLRDVGRASDECLKIIYPDSTVVRERAKILQNLNLSVYSR